MTPYNIILLDIMHFSYIVLISFCISLFFLLNSIICLLLTNYLNSQFYFLPVSGIKVSFVEFLMQCVQGSSSNVPFQHTHTHTHTHTCTHTHTFMPRNIVLIQFTYLMLCLPVLHRHMALFYVYVNPSLSLLTDRVCECERERNNSITVCSDLLR